MTHPLHSYRLKLNRAEHHKQALQREIEAWFDRRPYGVFGEYEPGPPEHYVFRVRFFEEPPSHWGILLGDFAHDARSGLDHLVDALVRLNGGTPTRRTQFPVVLNPCQWEGREGRDRLSGAAERHVAIVESFQPYHRADLYGYSTILSAIDDPLAVLAHLSNVDKHRKLHAALVALRSIGYDLTPVNDVLAIALDQVYISWEPLEDGAELLRVPITSSGPHPEVQMKRHERLDISLSYTVETQPGFGFATRLELVGYLDAILSKLRHIFQVFIGEFR